MYSGWTVKWPCDRVLTQREREDALVHYANNIADDCGTLIAFNSTYVEFVDRRFRLRGWLGTLITAACSLGSFGFAFYLPFIGVGHGSSVIAALIFMSCFLFLGAWLFWWMMPLRDFFNHTYYPIRFNRRTRQVYVFRDKRDGGVLTVPWDEGFFHIGQGLRDKRLLDLRCHVLDGETVKDTFVTGMYYLQKEQVQQLWEFVRRYMDEDIESLGKVEIWTSPAPTLKNCRIMVGVTFGGLSGLGAILWPLAAPVILTRWLVLRTCKVPVWPAEIEAACRIEPNDPHHLPEPEYIGQFAVEREMAKTSHKTAA
jgi:hypothetical protein